MPKGKGGEALCALFDTSMKLSTRIVFPVTLNFWYSASADLTFGDLCSHFCVKNSVFYLYIPEAIVLKIQYFCLYIPEAIN